MSEGALAQVLSGNAQWHVAHGDCVPMLREMREQVDATISDPPFEAEAHTAHRRVKRTGSDAGERWGNGDSREAMTEALGFDPITPEIRTAVGAEIARLTKRWALVFCQVEATQLWRAALTGAHAYRRTAVWVKPDAQPQFSGDRPGMGYESIVITHANGRCRWNGGGKVGVFTHVKNTPGGSDHPTTKPLPLMMELVSLFTEPGEVVLDPFCGSSSTGLACLRLGRRYIGIEKDPTFHALSINRMRGIAVRSVAGQSSIFDVLGAAP